MGDTLFFIVSKLIWAIVSPDSLIVLLAAGAWLSAYLQQPRLSRILLSGCASLLLLISLLPLGEFLLAPLENRYPANLSLPAEVDGIIVLGGAINLIESNQRGQVELGAAADRLLEFHALADRYPTAQLLFTGGSGALASHGLREADFARQLFDQLGLRNSTTLYESESRNTFENVRNSKALVNPGPGQAWILVTSAFHVPRAMGIFCRQGWPVQPFPVDFYTRREGLFRLEFNLAGNLWLLRLATREWAGLIAYRVTGRSAQLLPGPDSNCATTG